MFYPRDILFMSVLIQDHVVQWSSLVQVGQFVFSYKTITISGVTLVIELLHVLYTSDFYTVDGIRHEDLSFQL